MATYATSNRYTPVGGVWTRKGHPNISPPGAPPVTTGYDWTVNPYGSLYDARASSIRQAGGYTPTATTSGIPSGTTLTNTVTGSSGYLTLSSANIQKGTATISTAGVVTLAGHGLVNGYPIYFSSLTGGAGLATGPVAAWYVVANSTTNTFTLKKCDPNSGLWSVPVVSTAYTAAVVQAGLWYDTTTFNCDITTASTTTTGLVLITRSLHASATTPPAGSYGMIYNNSTNMVFISADSNYIPQSLGAEHNGTFGYNIWTFRNYVKWGTDGHGSKGGTHHFGELIEKFFWTYPNPNHSDGSHCDGMQIHLGDVHVMRGCAVYGLVDAAVSTTTDSVNHPVPAYTTSCVLVGNIAPQATGVDVQYNQFFGAAEQVNIASANFANLGIFKNNQHHLRDAGNKSQYPQGIVAPNTGSGFVIHADIPLAGSAGANVDENGTAFSPFSAAGSSVTWP